MKRKENEIFNAYILFIYYLHEILWKLENGNQYTQP
jgi:hypothetical protein